MRTDSLALSLSGLVAAQSAPRPRRQEKQEERDARARRVKIYPGDVTVHLYERVVFSAVALDAADQPVGGVGFAWSAIDEGRGGHAARISRRGEFEATATGTYKVTADAGGKKDHVTVTVLNGPRRASGERPSRVISISSRKRAAKVSATRPQHRRARRNATPKFVKASLAKPTAAPFLDCGDEFQWNTCNFPESEDPGNRRGNPPGSPVDQGAGNGNFQINAPILSLPGRGLDLGLGFVYNSRVWTKNGTKINYDIDQDWPAAGWSFGFGKIVGLGLESGAMIIDADGTRHGFAGNVQPYSWGSVSTLHTTDGTFINYTTTTNTSGTITGAQVKYPNGTVVRYGAMGAGAVYPTSIVDDNGNFVNISYVGNVGPRIQTVTDTLGRVVNFHYDSNNLLTAIVGPSLDGGTRPLVRLHYKQLPTLSDSFVGLTPMVRSYTPWALDALYYPATGTGYWFGDSDSYSSYGMIQKVVEQRGMGFSASSLNEQGTVTQGVMSRQQVYDFQLTNLTDAPTFTSLTESYDGMDTAPAVTTFLAFQNSSPRTVTITLPNGTQSIQHSFNHPGSYDDGLVYHDETKDSAGNILQSSDVVWQQGDYESPRPVSTSATDEGGQRTGTELSYGATRNQVIEARSYDYGYTYLGSSNVLLRRSVTQYHTSAGYAANNVYNLPTVMEIYDGAGTRVSRTEYQYDGATPPSTPNGATSLANLPTAVAQHDDGYNPYTTEEVPNGNCCLWASDETGMYCDEFCMVNAYVPATDYRGNITQVTNYSNAASEPATGAITQTRSYDITGNAVTASASCCQQVSVEYTQATQYAYPTSQTRGSSNPSSPVHITTGATYDFNTGLSLSATDADGRTSQTTYDSTTLRPQADIMPTGGRTTYGYDESLMKVTQTTLLSSGGAVAAKSVVYLNGLGQVKREEALGAPEASTWESSVLDVMETQYDQLGRVLKQSHPYRNGSEQPQWTINSYDALGRVWKVESPDGSVKSAYFNDLDPAHPRPSIASTAPGETTLVVDAWGRERWGRTDSQGRLVEVVEPDPDGSGIVTTNGLLTSYSYDTLGSLTEVVQGAQHRKFAYDSLGRIVRQKLAETDAVFNDAGQYVGSGGTGVLWSDLFEYDFRSNLASRTDARNVKTNFSYQDAQGNEDPLNRLQSVSYVVQTGTLPSADSVNYEYATAGDLTNVRFIRTKDPVTGSVSTTEEYRYDAEGRADQKTATLASRSGFELITNYTYDNLDRVTDVIYPRQYPSLTRKTVHHDFDVASRLSGFTVDGAACASQLDYNASSQTKTLKVGVVGANQVTEKYVYDAATGLLTEQRAYRGSDETANRLLHLSYDYLRSGTTSGRTGQLTKITDSLNPEKGRTYSYDALGRLKHVGGGNPALAAMWTQDYSYDRYGNRKTVTASGNTASLKAPADPQVKTPDVELAANTFPKVPGFLREKTERSVTDAPNSPLLSGAAAKNLAGAAFAPGTPTNLTVTASSATQVSLSWSAPAGGADHYEVERGQSLAGQYTFVGTAAGSATTFSDTTVGDGSAYLYRVRAVDAGGSRSAPSNVALGAAFTFTDSTIIAQTTTVKAQHLTELRQAVNAVRGVAGLSAATWTDATLTPQVSTIRAVHIQELRDRLNEALTALQISTSPFTDPVLATGASGTVMKKAHVDELRQRATRGQSASSGGSTSIPVPRDGFETLSYDGATNRINTAGWEYDAAGNQTRVQVATNVWQRYEYDAANRLVTVKTDADAVVASYTYCYSNARLISQEGAMRTYYAWGSGGVVAEYTEVDGTPSATSPQWSKSYIFLGGRLLATQQPIQSGERVEYHHPDRLGTRVVSNNADATYYEQTSLPFGTALNAESTGATNRRFTSYDRSSLTGLDYAVNRSYDSQQGRFTQVDPIGMRAASLFDPQTLNLYSYCGNDPINNLDPSGLFWGKLFRAIGKFFKVLKWVAIAVAITVAVVAVVVSPAAAVALLLKIGAFLVKIGVLKPVPLMYGATETGGVSIGLGAVGKILVGVGAVGAVGEHIQRRRKGKTSKKVDTKKKVELGGTLDAVQAAAVTAARNKAKAAIEQNKECADLLGGKANALGILDRTTILNGSTINPDYTGLGINPDTGMTATAEIRAEMTKPDTTVIAMSPQNGRHIFLHDRFYSKDLNTQAMAIIHEMKHLNGAGGEIDKDYQADGEEIRKKCGLP